MPFKPGQSGNPGGKPKGTKNDSTESPVHQAWQKLVKEKPWLLKEAFERGLEGRKASVYLELGAKLGKEIGGNDEGRQQVVIIMNSPLNAGALKQGLGELRVVETRALPEAILELNEVITPAEVEMLEDEEEERLDGPGTEQV